MAVFSELFFADLGEFFFQGVRDLLFLEAFFLDSQQLENSYRGVRILSPVATSYFCVSLFDFLVVEFGFDDEIVLTKAVYDSPETYVVQLFLFG